MTDTLGLTTGDGPAAGAPRTPSRADRAGGSSRWRSTRRPDPGRAPSPTARRRRSDDLEPGEAVLVPFGKGGRQAIGVVTGARGRRRPAGELRDLVARVRSDGPLLPPLALAFAARPGRPVPRAARRR